MEAIMIFNLPNLQLRPGFFNRNVGKQVDFLRNNFILYLLRSYQILLIFILLLAISGCSKTAVESVNQSTIDSFDNSSVTKVINDLIQLDIDTYHPYMH